MPVELEIDVPESRQVTLTLPPEVPVGKVKLTVQTPFDPAVPIPGTSEKFQRERVAFYRLLPDLLKTHRGKMVAIHDERVIAVGDERLPVAHDAFTKIGGRVDLFVERVEETPPIYRLKTPRELRRESP